MPKTRFTTKHAIPQHIPYLTLRLQPSTQNYPILNPVSRYGDLDDSTIEWRPADSKNFLLSSSKFNSMGYKKRSAGLGGAFLRLGCDWSPAERDDRWNGGD